MRSWWLAILTWIKKKKKRHKTNGNKQPLTGGITIYVIKKYPNTGSYGRIFVIIPSFLFPCCFFVGHLLPYMFHCVPISNGFPIFPRLVFQRLGRIKKIVKCDPSGSYSVILHRRSPLFPCSPICDLHFIIYRVYPDFDYFAGLRFFFSLTASLSFSRYGTPFIYVRNSYRPKTIAAFNV